MPLDTGFEGRTYYIGLSSGLKETILSSGLKETILREDFSICNVIDVRDYAHRMGDCTSISKHKH